MTRAAPAAVALLAGVAALALPIATRVPSMAIAGPDTVARWLTWSVAFVAGTVAALTSRRALRPLFATAAAAALLAEELVSPFAPRWALQLGLASMGTIAPLALVPHLSAALPVSATLRRAAVAALAVGSLSGPVAALWVDPATAGCHACAETVLRIGYSQDVADVVARIGGGVTAAVAGAVIVLALRARRATTRSDLIGALAATVVALAFSAVRVQAGALGVLTGYARLASAVGLLVASVALLWPSVEEALQRAYLIRAIGRLADAHQPGRLQDVLARVLKDPALRIGYIFEDSIVDLLGRPFPKLDASLRTHIQRGGEDLAVVDHSRGVLDNPGSVEMITSTAALAFEYEREAAQLAASSRVLGKTRRDAIAAADSQRDTLVRELHDHAQQRLVAIMVRLRTLAGDRTYLDETIREVQAALDGVRAIGRSIFPAALTDDGLSAALEELAVDAAARIVVSFPEGKRLEPVVEATVYLLAAALSEFADATIRVQDRSDVVVVTARPVVSALPGLEALRERSVAVGGSWAVEGDCLEVTHPCGS